MIAALRATLAADLEAAGVTVHPAYPDRLSPPCLVVSPPASGQYVTSGPNFGATYTVHADVVALVAKGTPSLSLADLDDLVEAILTNTVDWSLDGVDAPAVVAVGSGEMLGTVVHLSKSARLT